jgi:hypothetical protein
MLVRFVFVPLRAREKMLGLFLYMLFNEGCLYWLNIWALFTVKNRSWVTRTVAAQAELQRAATAVIIPLVRRVLSSTA